ncbi:hypothetical protein ACTFIV_001075 [Dictyostelium citrinum]
MEQVFTYNYSLDKIFKEHNDFIEPTFIIECPPTPKLKYDIEDIFYHQQTFIVNDQYQLPITTTNNNAILVVDNQLKNLQVIEIEKEKDKEKEKEEKKEKEQSVDKLSLTHVGYVKQSKKLKEITSKENVLLMKYKV